MNLDPKKVAVDLMFSALGEILKDIDSGRELLGDKPVDMKFDNYDLLGFCLKRGDREGDHDNDIYYVGIKVRLPDCYPFDAYECIRTGVDLFMRSNGKMTHLFSFNAANPRTRSNEELMIIMDRCLHENTELLEAVSDLTMDTKYVRRKNRK